jgi:DNA ligase (NAD+)
MSQSDLLNFSHNLEEIEQIPDIGPEVAKNVSHFFNDEKNKILLEKLTNLLDIQYYKKPVQDEGSFFFGKTVCITGSFEHN